MGMLWPTLEVILGLAMVIVLFVGGRQVLTHRISVGNFTAFMTYLMMLTWPIIAVGWVVNLFERGTASVTRIQELLEEKPSIDDRDATPALARTCDIESEIRGDIEFRNLSFAYPNADGTSTPDVLHNINLEDPRRLQPRPRRPNRIRQDHPRQPDPAPLRRSPRNGAHRRPPRA